MKVILILLFSYLGYASEVSRVEATTGSQRAAVDSYKQLQSENDAAQTEHQEAISSYQREINQVVANLDGLIRRNHLIFSLACR